MDNGLQGGSNGVGGTSDRSQQRHPDGLENNSDEVSYDASMSKATSIGNAIEMAIACAVGIRMLGGHAVIVD